MAVAWIGLVVWALVTGAWSHQGIAAGIVLVALGLLNLGALISAAWWLRRQKRQAHVWAALVLLANAALTVTDQMGWIDTLYLAITLAALGAVLVRTRWYWRRAARRAPR